MNRLTSELYRLYSPTAPDAQSANDATPRLTDDQGRARALVMELGRPADWSALSLVWQGVQADLGLPAPAIVVQGVDAFQLWFSVAEPLPAAAGHALLAALAARYLGEVAPHRLRLLPAAGPSASPHGNHAALVPQPRADEQWSAFVSADLAPMFNDTPWLDMAPNPDGQAGLLSGLKCIQPAALQEALSRLHTAADAGATAAPAPLQSLAGEAHRGLVSASLQLAPRRFLLAVMNDEGAALALRIEAAKALLPYLPD
jgi:hypothetical protein